MKPIIKQDVPDLSFLITHAQKEHLNPPVSDR